MNIEIGIKAPEFAFLNENGDIINLKDFYGKWVVLYFYPKDNTPGCTMEACSFRDNYDDLTNFGVVVIGVSPDSGKSHEKFRKLFNLNFYLAPDTDKKICELYGVIGEKTMFGKKFKGVIRSTFIIDTECIVRHVFRKVKVSGHTDEVKKVLKSLKKINRFND